MSQSPQDNFRKAIGKLESFLDLPVETDRDKAGIIQAFEYTFEQCWKAIQKIAKTEGFEAKSPREALQRGIEIGVIEPADEEQWIQMLNDRNQTSHLYQEELVEQIYHRISDSYLKKLQGVLLSLDER